MEHVYFWPGYELTEHDLVPYCADEKYLNVPFLEYVSGIGPVDNNRVAGSEQDEADSLVQTCLFFSILQEILGTSFSDENYVKFTLDASGDLKPVVTTELLNDNLRSWIRDVQSDPVSRKDRESHLRKCFDEIEIISSFIPKSQARVSLSALTFLCSAQYAIMQAFGLTNWSIPSMRQRAPIDDEERQMVQYGCWCPFEARKAWMSWTSVNSTLLLRSMKRSVNNEQHKSCTLKRCEHATVRADNYKHRHASEQCSCESNFAANETELSKILRSGKMPVLEVSMTSSGELEDIRLMPADDHTNFVAISHVWADGLGNPTSNALRWCQVESIARKVFAIPNNTQSEQGKIYIWIDTLCVPTESEDDKLLALSGMLEVYKSASCVLVLDIEIQAHEFNEDEGILAGMVVFSSRWMWRLWTLQESLAASTLYVQFANASVDIIQVVDSASKKGHSNYCGASSIADDIIRQCLKIRSAPEQGGLVNSVEELYDSVTDRMLSKPSDEPLCLANICGFEVAQKEDEEGKRMSTFWRTLCEKNLVPQDIIFTRLQRLRNPGYRWGPASLLRPHLEYAAPKLFPGQLKSQMSLYSSNGIKVSYPGIIISPHSRRSTLDYALSHFRKACLLTCLVRDPRRNQWYEFSWDLEDDKAFEILNGDSNCVIISEFSVFELADTVPAASILGSSTDLTSNLVHTIRSGTFRRCSASATELLNRILEYTYPDDLAECMPKVQKVIPLLSSGWLARFREGFLENARRYLYWSLMKGWYFDISEKSQEPHTWFVD